MGQTIPWVLDLTCFHDNSQPIAGSSKLKIHVDLHSALTKTTLDDKQDNFFLEGVLCVCVLMNGPFIYNYTHWVWVGASPRGESPDETILIDARRPTDCCAFWADNNNNDMSHCPIYSSILFFSGYWWCGGRLLCDSFLLLLIDFIIPPRSSSTREKDDDDD